jgi:hypothetical protein
LPPRKKLTDSNTFSYEGHFQVEQKWMPILSQNPFLRHDVIDFVQSTYVVLSHDFHGIQLPFGVFLPTQHHFAESALAQDFEKLKIVKSLKKYKQKIIKVTRGSALEKFEKKE